MSRAASSDGSLGDDRHLLPAGFYQLALLAALLAVAEIRWRPVPGLPNVPLFELVVIPAIAAMILERMLRPRMALGDAIYRPNRPLVWYVGYAGFASVVGLARSSDSLQAFHDLLAGFGLYALVVVTVDTRRRLLGLLATNLAGAIPNLVVALLQNATDGFTLVPRSDATDAKLDVLGEFTTNAPTGLLAHPNNLAHYLLPIAIFLAVAAWRGFGKDRRRSLVLAGILASTLFVLTLTNAKGVYSWLVVGLGFLALPRRFERWRFWIAAIAPIVGIVLLLWLSIQFFLEGDLKYGTVVDRVSLWLAALHIITSDGFVALVGSGGPQLVSAGLGNFEYANAHNTWISQALTYGVPAFAGYMAAFGSALRSLDRWIRSGDASTRMIALAAMAALTALLGENFFEPADRGSTVQAHLFLLFAVAARAVAPELPELKGRDSSAG